MVRETLTVIPRVAFRFLYGKKGRVHRGWITYNEVVKPELLGDYLIIQSHTKWQDNTSTTAGLFTKNNQRIPECLSLPTYSLVLSLVLYSGTSRRIVGLLRSVLLDQLYLI